MDARYEDLTLQVNGSELVVHLDKGYVIVTERPDTVEPRLDEDLADLVDISVLSALIKLLQTVGECLREPVTLELRFDDETVGLVHITNHAV